MIARVPRAAVIVAATATLLTTSAAAQTPIPPAAVSGLPLRSIGPALMGGRISDVAVHPRDRHTWYVAVGSGGVWKTLDGGLSWTPLIDGIGTQTVGSLHVEPANPPVSAGSGGW